MNFSLFVSIPHSGIKIPPEAVWLKDMPFSILMCDVDAFVDELYSPALKELNIPAVVSPWHRYAVDLNRFSTDISPLTVSQPAPSPAKSQKARQSPSDIHWLKTTKGHLLIKKPLSPDLHKDLIKKYFIPFHKKIKKQIAQFQQAKGCPVCLLDLHSMPSQGLAFHRDPGAERPEIVISDYEGQTCSKALRDLVAEGYKAAGFEVAFNWPYKGGAIAQRYGQPHKGREALQVELNRKLYMDEESKQKTSNYKRVQSQLSQALAFIMKSQKDFLKGQSL